MAYWGKSWVCVGFGKRSDHEEDQDNRRVPIYECWNGRWQKGSELLYTKEYRTIPVPVLFLCQVRRTQAVLYPNIEGEDTQDETVISSGSLREH